MDTTARFSDEYLTSRFLEWVKEHGSPEDLERTIKGKLMAMVIMDNEYSEFFLDCKWQTLDGKLEMSAQMDDACYAQGFRLVKEIIAPIRIEVPDFGEGDDVDQD